MCFLLFRLSSRFQRAESKSKVHFMFLCWVLRLSLLDSNFALRLLSRMPTYIIIVEVLLYSHED